MCRTFGETLSNHQATVDFSLKTTNHVAIKTQLVCSSTQVGVLLAELLDQRLNRHVHKLWLILAFVLLSENDLVLKIFILIISGVFLVLDHYDELVVLDYTSHFNLL